MGHSDIRPTGCSRVVWGAILGCLLLAAAAVAKDIYVNNQTGHDQGAGTAEAPLRSIRRAVTAAQEGDVIHLLPERGTYREMIVLANKRGITIEGHDCVVSGADPLPSDPARWETLAAGLHRIQVRRPPDNRHLLVVQGRGVTMGRNAHTVKSLAAIERRDGLEAFRTALAAQFPKPQELRDGQFAWEPIDATTGWLYVRGPLENLAWAVRTQGIQTSGQVHDVTIRNLHARYALNDGYNIHGNAQGIRLYNVSGNDCFDNGISPHGACSFSVQDGEFLRNDLAVGNDFLTETHFLRCTIGFSAHEEVMIIGGRHVFEDCVIRSTGPNALRLVYSRPGPDRPMAMREIEASGKDPNMTPQYTFRNCTIESADGKVHAFLIEPNVTVLLDKCTLRGIELVIAPAANVTVTDCTLDGKPLTAESLRRRSAD